MNQCPYPGVGQQETKNNRGIVAVDAVRRLGLIVLRTASDQSSRLIGT